MSGSWRELLWETLNREPPEPQLDEDLPDGEDFYEGEIPEWTPDDR